MCELAEQLGPHDLRIGNFESPLWGNGGVNVLKVPRLCTTREAAACLTPLCLDVALLGNNHVYDCLEQGFTNTIRFLQDNGIQWLGAGRSSEEASRPLVLTRRGIRLGLLNYVSIDTHPNVPPEAEIKLNMLEENRALAEVEHLAKEVDHVIVFFHWGADELVRYPTVAQRRFARQTVEAGAAVVACSHAHCIQGYENWKNGYVFYGLGNFLFHDFGGRIGREWPEVSRLAGVFCLGLGPQGLGKIAVTHLLQEGLALKQDKTLERNRQQARLNRVLKLSDRKLAGIYRREVLRQRLVVSPLRFIRDSGGVLGAVKRLRRRDLIKIRKMLCD